METLTRIKQLLVDTEDNIQLSGQQYAELEAWGYRNLELEALHHQAREVRSRLRQIFHSFDMQEISNYVGEIQQTVERTEATHGMVSRLRSQKRQQTIHGVVVTAMLLVFAGLLVYYRHAFLHPPDSRSAEG